MDADRNTNKVADENQPAEGACWVGIIFVVPFKAGPENDGSKNDESA